METEVCAKGSIIKGDWPPQTPEHELLLMYERPQTQNNAGSNKTEDGNDSIEEPQLS
jgi:hypothetical protein